MHVRDVYWQVQTELQTQLGLVLEPGRDRDVRAAGIQADEEVVRGEDPSGCL
jgi:hypothetical protein